MTQLAEAFAWCILQVSIFALMLAFTYLAARRWRRGGNTALLLSGFFTVGLLTLLCLSPWPRWSTFDLGGINPRTNISGSDVNFRDGESSNGALNVESPASTDGIVESLMPGNSGEVSDLSLPAATQLNSSKSEAVSPRTEREVTLWIVGVRIAWAAAAIGLVRFLIAAAVLRQLRRSSVAVEEPSFSSVFEELSRQVELKHRAQLRESPTLGVAATCGWWKPVVLLPAVWRQWTPDQRRAVLAHELAHIREGHYPTWLCSQLAVVAHYYHPVVHWLARQLRFEQEVAADGLAARVFGDRRRYASALATLALGAAPPSGAAGSLGLFMSKPFLMRRLAMLRDGTDPQRLSGRVKRFLPISLVVVAGIAVVGVRGEDRPRGDESAGRASTSLQEVGIIENKSTAQDAVNTAVAFLRASAPERYVTVLFRVSREKARLLEGSSSQSDAAWEVFCKTQIALLKSYFVLQAAVRDPEIAALPMIAAADDPVGFLAQRLDVGFYPGSEILYVRMGISSADEADKAIKIVDAVAKAYEEEVIFKDEQRKLTTRDLIAKSKKRLSDEIMVKREDYNDMARGADVIESESGQVAQQLDIRRLERIEEELLRLENDFVELQTSGKSGNVKFYEQRIAQLSQRQEELVKTIMKRSQSSLDLDVRRREIEQLQRVADDLSAKLELMEIEGSAPNRIELIQPAVITRGADLPVPPPAK